jgi:hypothetical protein
MGKLMVGATCWLSLSAMLLVLIAGLLGLPTLAFAQAGGELKQSDKRPGFVIIQNGDAGPGTNGQSVILVAPKVNNNQLINPLSAFLNNVVTDQDCIIDPNTKAMEPCFIQVGFQFKKELGLPLQTKGEVVWTDTHKGLGGKPFEPPIPYIPGHEYFTVIQYTNGKWRICAVDLKDINTSRCALSTVGGTYMQKAPGTGIFAENYNANVDWYLGDFAELDLQWSAYDATTYIGDIPHEWSSEILGTQDACEGYYPPELAVLGSLVGSARANILTSGIPLYCTGVRPEAVGQPVITRIDPSSPLSIPGDGKSRNVTVSFTDSNAGIVWAQLDLLTDTCGGCLTPLTSFDPQVSKLTTGQFNMQFWCKTTQGFSWTLQVYLKDMTGLVSPPKPYEIKCVPPSSSPPPIARIAVESDTEDQGGSGP